MGEEHVENIRREAEVIEQIKVKGFDNKGKRVLTQKIQ